MPAKRYRVKLTEFERVDLKKLVHTGKVVAYKRTHAQVLLSADEASEIGSLKDQEIAESLHISMSTVGRIRQRFVEQGLNAALERKPQENRRTKRLTGEGEAILIATACSQAPEGRTSWTLQLLADSLVANGVVEAISYESVRQVLKKTNLSLG